MATTGEAPTTPIVKAAQRLHEEAKGHMTQARQHRQRAATLHRDVEELRKACEELGVELVFDDE